MCSCARMACFQRNREPALSRFISTPLPTFCTCQKKSPHQLPRTLLLATRLYPTRFLSTILPLNCKQALYITALKRSRCVSDMKRDSQMVWQASLTLVCDVFFNGGCPGRRPSPPCSIVCGLQVIGHAVVTATMFFLIAWKQSVPK
jgi:hypothetical protein